MSLPSRLCQGANDLSPRGQPWTSPTASAAPLWPVGLDPRQVWSDLRQVDLIFDLFLLIFYQSDLNPDEFDLNLGLCQVHAPTIKYVWALKIDY